MSCAGVEPRSEADCEYTLDSGMLIKDIGYRCYSQIWNCYSYGKLIEGDEKSISLSWCFKSDRRGSNPRSRPWQGRALPTTPLSHKSGWWESNPRIQLGRLVFYHWTTPAYRCSRVTLVSARLNDIEYILLLSICQQVFLIFSIFFILYFFLFLYT